MSLLRVENKISLNNLVIEPIKKIDASKIDIFCNKNEANLTNEF